MVESVNSPVRYALVYGLSANPLHQGHIDLMIGALINLQNLGYDIAQTLIIPVYRRNPVGNPKDVLPETYEQRTMMCEIAAQEVRAVIPHMPINVSRIEEYLAMQNDTPNYTAETLSYLKTQVLSELELIFLISSEIVSGEDPELRQWHHIDTILNLTRLAVCPRPGFPLNEHFIHGLSAKGGRFIVLNKVTTPDISSTFLRYRLQSGENPLALTKEGLIPLSIALYLKIHNIYFDRKITLDKAQFHH
jgi:nicotinic acid mononucleotide adenylyltransferase